MTSTRTLLHRWFEEVWNKGHEDVIDELMAPDCIAHGLTDADGKELRGVAPYKAFFRKFRADFTDINIDLSHALTEGDGIAARCVVTGKHVPSGKPIKFTGMTLTRWRDGKIVEAWNNFDFHEIERQLS